MQNAYMICAILPSELKVMAHQSFVPYTFGVFSLNVSENEIFRDSGIAGEFRPSDRSRKVMQYTFIICAIPSTERKVLAHQSFVHYTFGVFSLKVSENSIFSDSEIAGELRPSERS